MRTLIAISALALALTIALPLTATGDERGTKTTSHWSGWSYGAADADSDGVPGGSDRAFTVGQGTGGRVETGTQSDIAPWDGSSVCDFVDGIPRGIELYYVSLSTIARYPNGDLLYSQLSSSPISSVCVDYTHFTFTAVIHHDVAGGTGRFRGATGNLTSTFSGGPPLQNGFNGFEGVTKGVIYRSR